METWYSLQTLLDGVGVWRLFVGSFQCLYKRKRKAMRTSGDNLATVLRVDIKLTLHNRWLSDDRT